MNLQTTALQRALGKFNIAEVARTGKICLKRGEALLDMGGWGDGQLKQMRDQKDRAQAASSHSDGNNGNGGADLAGASARGVDEGQDVYASGGNEKAGEKGSVCLCVDTICACDCGEQRVPDWMSRCLEAVEAGNGNNDWMLYVYSSLCNVHNFATVLMSATRYARCVHGGAGWLYVH